MLSCTMAATTGSLRIRSVGGADAALPGQLHLLAHAGKCNLEDVSFEDLEQNIAPAHVAVLAALLSAPARLCTAFSDTGETF